MGFKFKEKQEATKKRTRQSIEKEIAKLEAENMASYREVQDFDQADYLKTKRVMKLMQSKNTQIKRLKTDLKKYEL